jgi:hypothetical protein
VPPTPEERRNSIYIQNLTQTNQGCPPPFARSNKVSALRGKNHQSERFLAVVFGLYKPYKEIKLKTNNPHFTDANNVVNG